MSTEGDNIINFPKNTPYSNGSVNDLKNLENLADHEIDQYLFDKQMDELSSRFDYLLGRDSQAKERLEVLPHKESYRLSNEISNWRMAYLKHKPYVEHNNSGVKGIINVLFKQPELATVEHLLHYENNVGSRLFGEAKDWPVGMVPSFFYGGNDLYVPEWFFNQGDLTLHYEIHDFGVLKRSSRSDSSDCVIAGNELNNFVASVKAYHSGVLREIYGPYATRSIQEDIASGQQEITQKAA